MTNQQWQFEIPSVEHPTLLAAAVDEATRRGVTIGRVSMGSGAALLTDTELTDMLSLAHGHGIEVYTYVSPRNSFHPTPDPRAGEQLRGESVFTEAIHDVTRCVSLGVDGVLIADVGLLAWAGEAKKADQLGRLGLKTAAAIAPQNAETASVYERLGATSINVATSTLLVDLVAIRRRVTSSVSLDVYIEAPSDLGGGLRYGEVSEIVSRLAPVYLKIGIRNAPSLYPYGLHLEPTAERSVREKIRRAEVILGMIDRASTANADGRLSEDGIGDVSHRTAAAHRHTG